VVIGYHFLTVVTAPTVAEMAEISQKHKLRQAIVFCGLEGGTHRLRWH